MENAMTHYDLQQIYSEQLEKALERIKQDKVN